MKVNGWEPCFEELPERETKPLPFSVEALKYAFLAPSDTFHVVTTS